MKAIVVGMALLVAIGIWPGEARAWWRGPGCAGGAATVIVPGYPAWPAAPVYSPYVYSYGPYDYPYYGYGPSYFRPDLPAGANTYRNWRDTWQDDGVKVHSYTWH